MGSEDHSGWQGPQEGSCPTPWVKPWGQTMLLVALSRETCLEKLQGWRLYNLSRQPVSPLTELTGRKCFPVPSLNPSVFNVWSSLVLPQCKAEQSLVPSSPWRSCAVPLKLYFPQPLLNRSVPSSLCADPAGLFPQSPEHCRGLCLPRGSTLHLSCWILEGACQSWPSSLLKIPLDGNTDIKCIDWSQNHRAEWLERTSGDHLVQPLCSKTDQLQQVTQDCVLLGFCYLQGQRLYSLLGNLFQSLIILTVKKLFLMLKQNF